MSTPLAQYSPPPSQHQGFLHNHRDSDDEGTLSNEHDITRNSDSSTEQNYLGGTASKYQSKGQEARLDDDLAMLQAERVVSGSTNRSDTILSNSVSVRRSRSRVEPVDAFDINTNPIHEKASAFKPPENPAGKFAKAFKRVHESSFLVRYFCYIVPLFLILLIPLLLGGLLFKKATVGGVRLLWFCVWLEIVWLTLWGGRILAKALPWPVGMVSSIFTNNSKKWRDMCKQLEIPATLFFWLLAVLVSFLPIMIHHHHDGGTATRSWEVTMNKVIVSFFVGVTLNFVEKIIIQLIAISFHLRTYADRIDINKFQIGSLTKLYQYSKEKIAMEDSDFEEKAASGPGSGARTPMQYLNEAQKKTRNVFGKVGDAAGKVAGDFTGKAVTKSTHPRQLVLLLLSSPSQSQILARRLYRTFAIEGAETIASEDLKHAFDNNEEADSAFSMFDKDMNGDISMNELEAVCVDIGKERKAITASLKDLDSVVAKLDAVLLFFVLIATLLVFLSLISTSAAGVLTSAGSAVLALSWLFSTTAQEFLASCIFVLVKHPFDVGDRVTIYGNTGASMKGDDYLVKEISLLYTEFKKMEGHIVQAPNSYLNTLFILNMRRSGGLAEAVPLTVKFGTTLDQIDELRSRLLEYVKEEKREYQPNILTEIRDVVEAYSVNLNVVFFYKSNWQNELLRLQRRNKFICALMVIMQDIGMEGPRRRIPGAKEDTPFYYAAATMPTPENNNDLNSHHMKAEDGSYTQPGTSTRDLPFISRSDHGDTVSRNRSILRGGNGGSKYSRQRGESVSAMSKRVDFSLGMKDISSADMMADLTDMNELKQPRMPEARMTSHSRSRDSYDRISEGEEDNDIRKKNSSTLERTATSASGRPRRLSKMRTNTAESQSRKPESFVHRNRFFSRSRNRDDIEEEEDLMEQGMADSAEPNRLHEKMDPRTGLISPQAVRPSNESNRSAGRRSLEFSQKQNEPQSLPFEQRLRLQNLDGIQTEDFEMKQR